MMKDFINYPQKEVACKPEKREYSTCHSVATAWHVLESLQSKSTK